ncbi:autotransporter-associated beta strand repeat-containing protein, partial [Flavobacterium sp. J49]|uniref:beta strand repeat-containing protein n=1 Tax=Flavobacterium sp. J49 TaxID=2718534 RepID=UPI0015940EE2
MKRILFFLFLTVTFFGNSQTTVTYVMQTGNFPVTFNDGGGFFNPSSDNMGMWANSFGTPKQAAAWRTFKTTGNNTGSNRSLQVGDTFVITVACTRAFGQIGFSLNAGGIQGSSYINRTSGSRLYVNTDNYGQWYVNRNAGVSLLGFSPIQSSYKDYRFTVRITSSTTADVFLTVDGIDYRAFNLTMNGSASIDSFSVYGSDMWDGDSNDDAFWKQTATVTNSKQVQLGYFLSSGTFTPGIISNGLDAASTSTPSVNDVFIGGDVGSKVVLNQSNTYSGATTINTNAFGELQNAQALGTTSGVTVQNNATLSLFSSGGGITYDNYPTILNGFGVSGSNGSLRSTGGNNIWPGNITLASASRINADVSGLPGSLTLSGTVGLGANDLTIGTSGADITISGLISGSGKIIKEGSGNLTLSANNTYSGSTAVNAGTLIVQKGGHSASITTGAIAFTFASTNQAAGVYDFLPGQLGGSTSRILTSNLVGGKTISFNYTTGDVTICDVMTVTTASIVSNNANSSFFAKSGDVITLSFTTSEAASVTPIVYINGNAATVTGSGTTWSASKTVVGGDADGLVTFTISFQNTFGCVGTRNTVTDGSSVTIDTAAPNISSATIASNNANSSSHAKTGNVITLSFTTSEVPVVTPSVSINGNAAVVTGGGTTWSATKTVVGGDASGIVTFSIGISDAAGNTATRTTTTDSSSVTIDNSSPGFVAVSIASNNAGNSSIAVPGDTVTLSFSTTESITTPTVVLNGVSATVSGSGTSWSATTTVLTCSGSVVSFSISISDIAGNTANSTSTTNSSHVSIGAQVGTPSFTAGATLVCQDAPNEIYTATAANATGGIFYGVEPEEAGVINDVTGVMNWDAAFSGEATITAYAFGCNGPTTSNRVVTVQSKYLFYVDADGDGYGSTTSSMECSSGAAVAPTGFSTNNTDCNDGNGAINPGAAEINFNNVDEDCDGSKFNGHAPVVSNITTASGTLAAMTTNISCSVATNTTPYSGSSVVHKFKVTRTSPAAAPVEFERASRTFAISELAIAAYSATYEVQATAIVNGEEQPYNGNTATFTTPAAPVIPLVSQVVTNQCNQTLATINSYIYANNSTMYNN